MLRSELLSVLSFETRKTLIQFIEQITLFHQNRVHTISNDRSTSISRSASSINIYQTLIEDFQSTSFLINCSFLLSHMFLYSFTSDVVRNENNHNESLLNNQFVKSLLRKISFIRDDSFSISNTLFNKFNYFSVFVRFFSNNAFFLDLQKKFSSSSKSVDSSHESNNSNNKSIKRFKHRIRIVRRV